MNLLESIQKETKDITKESYQLSFKTNALEYQSLLSGFNKKIFDLFNSHFNSLGITKSIQDLFAGKKINVTEDQSALHHIYRDVFSENPKKLISDEIAVSCKESI